MGESSYFLVQLARAVARSAEWRQRAHKNSVGKEAFVGPVVAGQMGYASANAWLTSAEIESTVKSAPRYVRERGFISRSENVQRGKYRD